jgi:hypothetical protein
MVFMLGSSLVAVLLGPVAMTAQAYALLGGIVSSSTSGGPVSGALVMLDSGKRAKTDAWGRFLLTDIIPGSHQVAIVTPGCGVSFATVELEPDRQRNIGFLVEFDPDQLTQLFDTDPLALVVTAEEIEAMTVQRLSHVLRRVVPFMVGGRSSRPGSEETRLIGRTRSVSGGSNAPVVVVDGVVLGTSSIRDIDDIQVGDVALIEILRGASGGWSYGTGGSGGVIKIWTKRGQGLRLSDPESCEVPEW